MRQNSVVFINPKKIQRSRSIFGRGILIGAFLGFTVLVLMGILNFSKSEPRPLEKKGATQGARMGETFGDINLESTPQVQVSREQEECLRNAFEKEVSEQELARCFVIENR